MVRRQPHRPGSRQPIADRSGRRAFQDLARGAGARFHHGAPGCSYFAAAFIAGRATLRAAPVFFAAAAFFLEFPFTVILCTTTSLLGTHTRVPVPRNCIGLLAASVDAHRPPSASDILRTDQHGFTTVGHRPPPASRSFNMPTSDSVVNVIAAHRCAAPYLTRSAPTLPPRRWATRRARRLDLGVESRYATGLF